MTSAGTPWGEPRRDALGESLDVFRGCGDHVYQNADCPHCTNNSAVVDKILQHLASQRQELGESPGRARSHLEMAEARIAQMQQSNGELRAQAAEQGAIIEDARVVCDKLEYQLAAKDALVARLVALLKRYRAHADNGVVDHRLDGVDEDTDGLLAELPPSRTP